MIRGNVGLGKSDVISSTDTKRGDMLMGGCGNPCSIENHYIMMKGTRRIDNKFCVNLSLERLMSVYFIFLPSTEVTLYY